MTDRHEHATPEDAQRWLATHYSQPRRPRLVPDPPYTGGAMVPIEYLMAEGSSASGREIVHHVLRRNGYRWRAAMDGRPEPVRVVVQQPAIVPTETHIIEPTEPSGRESAVLVGVVVLLVAAFVWAAAGMPL